MEDVLIDRTEPERKERKSGNKETSHTLSDTQHKATARASFMREKRLYPIVWRGMVW